MVFTSLKALAFDTQGFRLWHSQDPGPSESASIISELTQRCILRTPWSRILLEKLTGSQLVKKFPAFYGTRKFITVFTSARHLSLPWASSIQSIPSHPTSEDTSKYYSGG